MRRIKFSQVLLKLRAKSFHSNKITTAQVNSPVSVFSFRLLLFVGGYLGGGGGGGSDIRKYVRTLGISSYEGTIKWVV